MAVFDIDVGVVCDHRFRQFVFPQATVNPDEFLLGLLATMPPKGEKAVLFRNEVVEPGVLFLRQTSPKVLLVQDLVIPPAYPEDDFEVEYGVEPELCPKCKGQSPFGV